MDFEAWTSTGKDPLRQKRLLVGYVVGLFAVAGVAGFVVLTSKPAAANEDNEPVIEAQLAREPEPEPEPPPAPMEKKEAPKPPPPKPKIQAPTAVPEAPLKEAEANAAELAAESDPFERDEAPPEPEPAKPALIEAPKPPPPKPVVTEKKAPIRVTEDVTPPEAIGTLAKPDYPADAKARGVEGTVIVKYVVTESGAVTDVTVVKGPPEFHAVCLAVVKSWRFQPAMLDGKRISVVRMARFPFKIRT